MIGAGPAGLAAAEMLVEAGHRPVIFEAKPSAARKFLMAGKSGLNLTKQEDRAAFIAACSTPELAPMLERFGPEEIRAWAEGLGETLFTGSSGRVFPRAMKGSPLLRRWLARLDRADLRTRWRWQGWEDDRLVFQTPSGPARIRAGATVLALGGASWPRLGSDGAWTGWIGAPVRPFRPANMGFDVDWGAHFAERFAGDPVKPVALGFGDHRVRGEFVVTRTGIEGSAVYALSATLRDALERGAAAITLDLMPDRNRAWIASRLARPRGKSSRANHLRRTLGLAGVRAGLLRELAPALDDADLPERIKALTLPVAAARPLDEAISSAGGLAWQAVDAGLMLRARPGTFAAGEMLDWEAPTGGYLITASLATGRWAGQAAADWLKRV